MYFMHPKSISILVKINFHAYAFWGYFILLLMVFCTFLEPNMCFTLKMDSSVCDSYISSI